MKATGIVRRIDDLGRVVIPKEIRRTLRIREGDPLEIFTDSEGGVIFKKYSPVGEISPMAAHYTDVLAKTAGMPCLVCDRDHVIAAAGVSRKEYIERRISPALEEMIEARRSYFIKKGEGAPVLPVEGLDRTAAAVMPILAGGDVFGAVVLMSGDSDVLPGETEQKLAQTAAAFLSKLMEEE